MLKRKISTDSESSAKTFRLDSNYKYVKLNSIVPNYGDLILPHLPLQDNLTDFTPTVAQLDGVTKGLFIPSAFLEYILKFIDDPKLGQLIRSILFYKPSDLEYDVNSRKSSVDSNDSITRALNPELDLLNIGGQLNGDLLHDVCEQYTQVLAMKPQINTEVIRTMKNEDKTDNSHNTSEDSEMGEPTHHQARRGSSGGQKGIYGSYARKIEAIHRKNEEDIKNVMEATFYKPPSETPAKSSDVKHENTTNSRIPPVPAQYNVLPNGMIHAVPLMHPTPVQCFIPLPVGQPPYLGDVEGAGLRRMMSVVGCKYVTSSSSFSYPQMQFLQINPFIGQPMKQEDRSKVPGLEAVTPR